MTEKTEYPRRAYEWWTDELNTELVELLRTGMPIDELALRTGRSKTALRAQCHKMLPPHFGGRTRNQAVTDLSVLVADPSYDWREPLREFARRARSVYWDAEMNTALHYGWEAARPLEDLCGEFDASEIEVGRQLLRLGVAENMSEVAERLGCDPHSSMAARLRLAADRIGAAVWVLVVDGPVTGATKTKFEDAGPATRHVSVHPDYDTADLVLAEVLLDHLVGGGSVDEVTATIAERTIGDGIIGDSFFREGTDALPVSEPTTPPAAVDLDDTDAPRSTLTGDAAVASEPQPTGPRRWWSRLRS